MTVAHNQILTADGQKAVLGDDENYTCIAVLGAPTTKHREKHRSSDDLWHDYNYWKMLYYKFSVAFNASGRLKMDEDTESVVNDAKMLLGPEC